MKYLFFLLLFCLHIQTSFAQSKLIETRYAPTLNDSIKYTLYFPEDWEGWDNTIKHPVLYAINYGMMNGDYLQAQVSYFRKARLAMPNSLIVVIDASMQRMGYSYETGNLSPEGLDFVSFLRKDLIPSLEKKHNLSTFRTYIGHSFAASFANYLFLNEPGMFSGYVLLAPEKIAPESPPFQLSEQAKNYYNNHYTFYYTAVGEFDLKRRQDYAKEIQKETRQLDSSKFFFRYDSLALANHTNILTLAIEFSLEHTYQFYTPFSGKEEKNVTKDLQTITSRIHEMYGIDPEKIFTFYNPFAQEAVKNKDSSGLITVLAYFNNKRLKGWNLMQFGEYCLRLNLKENAKQYFEQAILKITSEEMNQNNGPVNLMNCYRHLAFDIYEKEHEKGWEALLMGLALQDTQNKYLAKDGKIYFDLGKFSAVNNYKVKDGLTYLLKYVSDKKYPANDMAFYYIAKNYLHLNLPKSAKPYLTKALTLNAENKLAAQLLKEIS